MRIVALISARTGLLGICDKIIKKIGSEVNIQHISNLREKKDRYYNPKHSNLFELGLEASLLSNKMSFEMLTMLMEYKNSIKVETISPRVNWN